MIRLFDLTVRSFFCYRQNLVVSVSFAFPNSFDRGLLFRSVFAVLSSVGVFAKFGGGFLVAAGGAVDGHGGRHRSGVDEGRWETGLKRIKAYEDRAERKGGIYRSDGMNRESGGEDAAAVSGDIFRTD